MLSQFKGLQLRLQCSRSRSIVHCSNNGDLVKLMDILPTRIKAELMQRESLEELIEITMDLGKLSTARFAPPVNSSLKRENEVTLSSIAVTAEDIAQAMSRAGQFDDDNRSGLDGTLHRISAIKSRSGKVVGLTCRVGRVIEGSAAMVEDLIRGGRSILLLGRPGMGKTTAIRDISYLLSSVLKKRTVIVDTSNEIGGDGDIPHRGIGDARRLQVPSSQQQHRTMIEAVENHFPQSIIIDEIGTEEECQAARTISQRGVQLVGTAHGQSLKNLVKNPSLNLLVGGVQNVTLGDEAAKKRNVQKTIQERAGPPTFDVCIEMIERHRWRIHTDVGASVDCILAGGEPKVLTRERDPGTGKVKAVTFVGILRQKLNESDEHLTAMEYWRTSEGEDVLRPIGKGGSSGGIPSSSSSNPLANLNVGKKEEEFKSIATPLSSPSPSSPYLNIPISMSQSSGDVVFRTPPSLLPLPPSPPPPPSPPSSSPPPPPSRMAVDPSAVKLPTSIHVSSSRPPLPPSPTLPASKQAGGGGEMDGSGGQSLPLDPSQQLPKASILVIEPEGDDFTSRSRRLSPEDVLRGDVARSKEEAWREGGKKNTPPPLGPAARPDAQGSNEGPWPKSTPSSTSPRDFTLEVLKQMTGKAPAPSPPLPPLSSGSNARRVFLYMDDETSAKVEGVLTSLPDFASSNVLTRDFDSAQIIVAASKKLRGNPRMKSMLTRLQVPIYSLRSSSTASIIRDLCPLLGLDRLLSQAISPVASFEEGDETAVKDKSNQPLGGKGRGNLSGADDFSDLLEQTVRELKGSPIDRDFCTSCLKSFLEEIPSGGCQASSIANLIWALSHSKHKRKLVEASEADLDLLLSQVSGRWGEFTPRDLLRISSGLSALRFRPPSSAFFSEIDIRIKAGMSAGSYKKEEEEKLLASQMQLSVLLEDSKA